MAIPMEFKLRPVTIAIEEARNQERQQRLREAKQRARDARKGDKNGKRTTPDKAGD